MRFFRLLSEIRLLWGCERLYILLLCCADRGAYEIFRLVQAIAVSCLDIGLDTVRYGLTTCTAVLGVCVHVWFPLNCARTCAFPYTTEVSAISAHKLCTRRVLYNYISCGFSDKLPVVNSNLSWSVTMATTDVHKQWLVDKTLAILSLQVTASTRWRSKITLLLLDIGLCPSLSTWLSRSRPRWVSIQTHTQDGYRFKF